MVVQHNISAMTANRYYTNNNSALGKSLEKLSSGLAINRAGDNAAGLAVSEKMRAQISGMTQASKNAQDGISMVQTFEGALQETDSILQRMRTLAVQSANGSYANEVDRDAIQLEFDQLNDELNQIADTDYNGVVVLNGGEMADGVKADAKGKIDYQAKIADDNAEKELLSKAKDFSGDPDGAGVIVDNAGYDKATADKVWEKLGLKQSDSPALDAEEINVTFTYDGSKWNATGVTDKDGKTMDIDAEKLASLKTTNQGNGGFSINDTSLNLVFDTHAAGKYDTATVKLTNSDDANYAPKNIGMEESSYNANVTGGNLALSTLTLDAGVTDENMTQDMADALGALKGATVTQDYSSGTGVTTLSTANDSGVAVEGANNPNLKLGITDDGSGSATVWYTTDDGTSKTNIATITAGALDAGATLETVYGAEVEGVAVDPAEDIAAAVAPETSSYSFAVKNAAGDDVTIYANADESKFYLDNGDGTFDEIGDADAVVAGGYKNGTDDITGYDNSGANHRFLSAGGPVAGTQTTGDDVKTLAAGSEAVTASTSFTLQNGGADATVYLGSDNKYYDESKAEITDFSGYTTADGASVGVDPDDGKLKEVSSGVTFKVNLDSYNFADGSGISAETIATPAAAKPSLETDNSDMVAVSNALGNGSRNLTYTQSMSLQTGARSKDLVEFTFKYNSDGMGDLKANMNCSAREDGLGTKDLSLKTQAEANAAIDKIDNAINKVSMVRATFGAIQNRLEHKISNLDTNAENVTAAESRIRDTQMDQEMMKFTSAQILSQASQSMLAQANSLPQGVLQLLG